MKKFLMVIVVVFAISFVSKAQDNKGLPHYRAEGEYAYNKKDYTSAIDFFNKAIELKADTNSYTYYLRGMSKSYIEDYAGAVADLTQAIKRSPSNKNSGWNLYSTGLTKIGEDKYIMYMGGVSFDKYYDAFFYRGKCKAYLNDFRGAIKDFDSYIMYEKESSGVFFLRGFCNYNLNTFTEAKKDLLKSIEIDPEHSYSYFYLGLVYIDLQDSNSGCLYLSQAGELGAKEAYEMIDKYCK